MKTSLTQKIGILRDNILDKTWKKVVVALVLTSLLIGGLGFGYIWTNPGLKKAFFGPRDTSVISPTGLVLTDTDRKLLEFNPVETLIKKKTVKDLPIYPKTWQKQNFTDAELNDQNTSGPDADPDRDGLTNKEEYIYGSNPKNPDTLGAGGKDGEYVQAGNNPLSGLPLEGVSEISYYFLNTDIAILDSLNDDLDTLENEGINIPVLYEAARKEDFSAESAQIKLNVIEDPTRDASLSYLNERLGLLKDIAKSNYFTNLSNIYKVQDVNELAKLKSDNKSRIITLEAMGVPKPEEQIHRAMVYFFTQIDKLIDLRIQVITKGLVRKDYDQKQKDIILRSVWAHRQINNVINQLSPNK